MESKIVKTGDLYSVAINADKVKTKELDITDLQINAAKIDTLTSSSITTDNIASTHMICKNLENKTGLISVIQNETLESKKLQSETIDCNHLDAKDVVLSTAVIDILEARYIKCNTLKTEDPQTFGTNESPLFLAHTRQKRLKVETAGLISVIQNETAGLISVIQNETLESKKLQSETIDCNHLDAKDVVLSTAVIDILEARYIKCNTLKTEDPQTFGTNESPLFLAHTRQKRLKVETADSNFL